MTNVSQGSSHTAHHTTLPIRRPLQWIEKNSPKAASCVSVECVLIIDTLLSLSLSPTQAYSSILVVMVILLNIGVAILFIHFFI